MAVRVSIRGLEQNPAEIARLRRAYARMKSLNDDRGYDFFASIHGLAMPIWCHHGTALFLPWHRAFLYFFELGLQTRLGPRFTTRTPADGDLAEVGLPWWDWTSELSHSDGLPDSYTDPDPDNPLRDAEIGSCAGGQSLATGVWSAAMTNLVRTNPGLSGTITTTDPPTTQRFPGDPADLPTGMEVDDDVMSQTTFDSFSTALENVHNSIHVWVGGAMAAVPTSAYDPIFWSHHAMIDRLWYIWQLSQNGVDPPASLMNVVLAPFPMTVADTLAIANLRYDYAVQDTPIA